MDTRTMREKLRLMTELAAELLLMLPDDEPTRPHLVLIKGGDDISPTPKPFRAREGFPIICDLFGGEGEAGEEARYQMRRDQIVVTLPISKKKPSGKNPTGWRCLERRRQREEVSPKRH